MHAPLRHPRPRPIVAIELAGVSFRRQAAWRTARYAMLEPGMLPAAIVQHLAAVVLPLDERMTELRAELARPLP